MSYSSGGNQLLNPSEIFSHLELRPGMRVAYLGCGGSGHFTLPAAKLIGQQGLLYAIDIRKAALNAVASRARLLGLSNVKTVWANLEIAGSTKIVDNSVDTVFLINMLFQAVKHKEVLTEAIRILKPGGQLLAIDWAAAASPLGPPLDARIQPDKIRQLLVGAGLQVREEFRAGNYHYGLVFVK